jgi:hypothetical protein
VLSPVLPVLDRDIVVTTVRRVAITSIAAASGQPIVPGSQLVIAGTQLRAQPPATTVVVVDGTAVAPALLSVSDSRITLQLRGTLPAPSAGLALPVGAHSVRVEHRVPMGRQSPPTAHALYESGLAGFVLQPSIGAITPTPTGAGPACGSCTTTTSSRPASHGSSRTSPTW